MERRKAQEGEIVKTDWLLYLWSSYWITIAIAKYLLGCEEHFQIMAGLAATTLYATFYAILAFDHMQKERKILSEIEWV